MPTRTFTTYAHNSSYLNADDMETIHKCEICTNDANQSAAASLIIQPATFSDERRRRCIVIGQYCGPEVPVLDDVTAPIDDVIDEKYGPSELCRHARNRR